MVRLLWIQAVRSLASLLLGAGISLALLSPRPASAAAGSEPSPSPALLLVLGAAGEKEFAEPFQQWAGHWIKAADQAGVELHKIGFEPEGVAPDLDLLRQALTNLPAAGPEPLWIVLIGHGTFANNTAKFNLRGPDFTDHDLAHWLQRFERPLAILNTASASGPFLKTLSGPNRIILTATRSGNEQNFARFGRYLAEAIGNASADLDKDDQTSLLEAYLHAAREVMEFYKAEGRLATEHALLEDNGDGLGTPPDWFRGVRAVKKARDSRSLDGLRAHQLHLIKSPFEQKMAPALRARRDELERQIARLRDEKSNLDEEGYYARLETLLVEMAALYQEDAPAGTP